MILERGYLTGLGLRAGAGGLWALLRAWSAGSAFFEEKTLLETFFNVRLFCVALHLFCGGGVGSGAASALACSAVVCLAAVGSVLSW